MRRWPRGGKVEIISRQGPRDLNQAQFLSRRKARVALSWQSRLLQKKPPKSIRRRRGNIQWAKEILINLLALSTVHIRLTPSLIVRRFRTMGSFSIPA